MLLRPWNYAEAVSPLQLDPRTDPLHKHLPCPRAPATHLARAQCAAQQPPRAARASGAASPGPPPTPCKASLQAERATPENTSEVAASNW